MNTKVRLRGNERSLDQGAFMRNRYRTGHTLVRTDKNKVAIGRATDEANPKATSQTMKRAELQRYNVFDIFRERDIADTFQDFHVRRRKQAGFVEFPWLITSVPNYWSPREIDLFSPRGIGTGVMPGCFICGGQRKHYSNGQKKYYSNITGSVPTKKTGEDIVGLFQGKGALLDYRVRDKEPYDLYHFQVKIGACDKHFPNLNDLFLVSRSFATLNNAMINMARG